MRQKRRDMFFVPIHHCIPTICVDKKHMSSYPTRHMYRPKWHGLIENTWWLHLPSICYVTCIVSVKKIYDMSSEWIYEKFENIWRCKNYNICSIGWHNIANLTYICQINTTHDVRVCIWNVSQHISRPNSYDMIWNWIYDDVV